MRALAVVAVVIPVLLSACSRTPQIAGRHESPATRRLDDAAEAIRARLPSLTATDGSFESGRTRTVFRAFADGRDIVLVEERRTAGDVGGGEAALYYDDGRVFLYTESQTRYVPASELPSGQIDVAYTIYFHHGRFIGGTKAENGEPAELNEEEVLAAQRHAAMMLERARAAGAGGG